MKSHSAEKCLQALQEERQPCLGEKGLLEGRVHIKLPTCTSKELGVA